MDEIDSQDQEQVFSGYEIIGEPISLTRGADLDYIFNQKKARRGSFRQAVVENLYTHLTEVGALWKIRISALNGGKEPSREFIEKKFNQVRTAIRDEAKLDPLWEPDEHGHYVRTTIREDADGVPWLWVQRLGPKPPIESTRLNR